MQKYIITKNEIEGFHFYPDAPNFCLYLKNRHRHIFVVRCWFKVQHNNREIEINKMQLIINTYLHETFGYPCEFEQMSCEDIAEHMLNKFKACVKVEVLEDNYGGATLSK